MKFLTGNYGVWALLAWTSMAGAQEPAADIHSSQALIVAVGAAGSPEFEGVFDAWADQWMELAQRQQWKATRIGTAPASDSGDSAGDRVADSEAEQPESQSSEAGAGEVPPLSPKEQLARAIQAHSGADRLWIVLLGHGTFSRQVAKFNLTGPDVASTELKDWLQPVQAEVVFINCSSSSAPLLPSLAGERRLVITATRSGSEFNFARFGEFLSQSVNDPTVDIDHDNEVSLLEAFLAAAAETESFYRDDARLTTEHALLDDNGDRVGTSADFYQGIRPVKTSQEGREIDGKRASRIILLTDPTNARFPPELAQQRQTLEKRIDRLREQKSLLTDEDYYDQLEDLMLQLAGIYSKAEQRAAVPQESAPRESAP